MMEKLKTAGMAVVNYVRNNLVTARLTLALFCAKFVYLVAVTAMFKSAPLSLVILSCLGASVMMLPEAIVEAVVIKTLWKL
jgi:hypothetical protein